MASSESFVQFVVQQMDPEGSYRKMFGEYGLYSEGKYIGCVGDDKVYIKVTDPGLAYIENPVMESPYDGAKPIFLVTDKVEDREWFSHLVRITAEALPEKKKKEKKS